MFLGKQNKTKPSYIFLKELLECEKHRKHMQAYIQGKKSN